MKIFQYQNFLSDKDEYAALRTFWMSHLKEALPEDEPVEAYANDRYANGTLFYDGNPIGSAVNWRNRHAVRIIQESPAELGEHYLSWEGELSLDRTGQPAPVTVTEKVIALTLTEQTLQRALAEIRQWLRAPSP